MSLILPTISALGTSWWIEVFEEVERERQTVIHDDCLAFLRQFETDYSRFKPDSYISRLNEERRLEYPTPELLNLLQFGVAQFSRTGGIFNIMVGATLVETGYDRTYSFTAKPELSLIQNPLDVLHISSEAITLDAGLVDIGGFGKGWAIDTLAKKLSEEFGLTHFLINGGGDMYATSDNGAPITIYLEHPTEPNSYLATTTLFNQGFAASSPHKRAWTHDGTTYTHIIDTGISKTTERPDATFIKAASACDADIFATVALLADKTIMQQFAEENKLGVASFALSDNSLSRNYAFSQSYD
jgi:thiamine biosynthesis lipoprotein